jgi:hypothetical protein
MIEIRCVILNDAISSTLEFTSFLDSRNLLFEGTYFHQKDTRRASGQISGDLDIYLRQN